MSFRLEMDTSKQAFRCRFKRTEDVKDVKFFVNPISPPGQVTTGWLDHSGRSSGCGRDTRDTKETRLGHWKNFPWPWLATAPFEVQPALQKEVPNLGIEAFVEP